MTNFRLVTIIAVVLALFVGGTAFAVIPHSTTGSITGCYKTTNPAKGSVIVIDAQAGASCPRGYAQLVWPSTDKTGVTGLEEVRVDGTGIVPPGEDIEVRATCPTNKLAMSGGYRILDDRWLVKRNAWYDVNINKEQAWEVRVRNTGTESLSANSIVVHAHCIDR